jgi:DNA-binding Lrp family transcriptional regulator
MPATETQWTFITNHARVLMEIMRDEDTRIRSIALALGLTERAVQRIITELDDEGFLSRERVGRRTVYTVDRGRKMRAPQAQMTEVGEVFGLLLRNGSSNGSRNGSKA